MMRIYEFLVENELLEEEQKGTRKQSRGTFDSLLIDKTVLRTTYTQQTNLAMVWIDYQKAYGLVPHTWIAEGLDLLGIAKNIKKIVVDSMLSCRTELSAGSTTIGEIKVNWDISQGDSLSPLQFITALIPISLVLRRSRPG